MARPLRDAWIAKVDPDDYEQHMAAIGQAQANAEHVAAFAALCEPPPGARILIAGAGTGQMFDFIAPSVFDRVRPVFSDINPRFLSRLRMRFPEAACVADDLEQPSLRGPFHAVCAVLVLEHVDSRRAIATLCGFRPRHVFLVIQQNPPGLSSAVTPSRVLPGTMQVFAETHPGLLDPAAVSDYIGAAGYRLAHQAPRPVEDGKTMLGLFFSLL